MPARPLTDEQCRAAADAVAEFGSVKGAARALGIAQSTFQHRVRTARQRGLMPSGAAGRGESEQQAQGKRRRRDARPSSRAAPKGPSRDTISQRGPDLEDCEDTEAGTRTIVCRDIGIRTVEELIRVREIDTTVWEVIDPKHRAWGSVLKLRNKDKDGTGGDTVHENTHHYIAVKLRRRVPRAVEIAAKELANGIAPRPAAKSRGRRPATKAARRPRTLAVCGPYDLHLGQLVWRGETGKDDDIKLAGDRFRTAIDAIADRIAKEHPDRIICPLGNDFIHFENQRAETASGKHAVDYDGRYAKVILEAHGLLEHLAEKFLAIGCGVEFVYVKDNHAPLASLHLCHWLAARYAREKRVSVDTGFDKYKFRSFGRTLLGFCHGHEVASKRLYEIMAEKAEGAWDGKVCREWHVGHLHTRRASPTDVPQHDARGGVVVRTNPALSVTSRYAHDLGFPSADPSICAWLYGTDGYRGELYERMSA